MSVLDNLKIKNASASVSGNSLHLINSASGKIKELKFFGESTQAAEPTPDNPQEIKSVVLSEIKTCGKNLLDCSGLTTQTSNGGTITPVYAENGELEYINVNGTFTAWTFFDTPLSELGQGSYIANGYCATTPISGVFMQFFKDSTSNQIGNDIGSGLSFTLEKNANVFARIVIDSGVTANNLKFYPMISVEGGEYEPYTESIATLSEPITLNGLNGVSDYVDVKRGVEHHKFAYERVLGSHIVNIVNYETGNGMVSTIKGKLGGKCISNKFIGVSYEDRVKDANSYRCYIEASSQVVFRNAKDDNANFSDLASVKSYFDDNEIYVLYELAEPIETPLPTEDAAALQALETFNPITNIFNDANAEMAGEYFKNNNIGQNIADVHKMAGNTPQNCLYIVSFDAESGELVTRSADYKE